MARGYRIAAIMSPCHGEDGGSTPPTRSSKRPSYTGWFFASLSKTSAPWPAARGTASGDIAHPLPMTDARELAARVWIESRTDKAFAEILVRRHDFWSMYPWRMPESEWRQHVGSDFDHLVGAKILRSVQLEATTHPRHPSPVWLRRRRYTRPRFEHDLESECVEQRLCRHALSTLDSPGVRTSHHRDSVRLVPLISIEAGQVLDDPREVDTVDVTGRCAGVGLVDEHHTVWGRLDVLPPFVAVYGATLELLVPALVLLTRRVIRGIVVRCVAFQPRR